jgi:hypothetical protein
MAAVPRVHVTANGKEPWCHHKGKPDVSLKLTTKPEAVTCRLCLNAVDEREISLIIALAQWSSEDEAFTLIRELTKPITGDDGAVIESRKLPLARAKEEAEQAAHQLRTAREQQASLQLALIHADVCGACGGPLSHAEASKSRPGETACWTCQGPEWP